MANKSTVKEGDKLDVIVSKKGKNYTITQSKLTCDIKILGEFDLNEGEQKKVSAIVSKTIFSNDDGLKTTFIRPTDDANKASYAPHPLENIAKKYIGDQEIKETAQRESMYGKAKKTARNQQRDPAVDPKLNKSE